MKIGALVLLDWVFCAEGSFAKVVAFSVELLAEDLAIVEGVVEVDGSVVLVLPFASRFLPVEAEAVEAIPK